MQTQISVFQFQASKNVRVEIKNGEPWFCLKDVAEILEIRDTKSKNFNLKEGGVERIPLIDNLGRKQEVTFINEPNLYRVIFRSRKAEAVQFQDWIFEEVIPAIRKTGGYQISDGLPAKTTADDRTPLRQAVAALVGRKGIDYSTAYGMIHQRFNVGAIEDIPAEKLPEAVAYVHALTLSDDRQPLLDGLDIERLAVTVYYGAWALEMLDEVAVPLKQLGHPKATTMHTLWAESRGFLRHNVQALRRILPALEPDRAAHVRGTLDRLQRLNARFI